SGVAVPPDDVAPTMGDEGTLPIGELILIGLIALDARKILLQPRQIRLEAGESEMGVELGHLTDGILDQVLVAQFIELFGAEQLLALFQFLMEADECAQHRLFQSVTGWRLQAMGPVEDAPQVDGG